MRTETAVCVYCSQICTGELRDEYGEIVLGRPMPVCLACDDDLQTEPGPWNDWG